MKPLQVQLFALAMIALASAGCGNSNQAPTAPLNVAPGRPQPIGFSVSGNVSLTSIGATSQLSAMATWPDGTTQNVTSDVRWRPSDTSVATISSAGLVTAVGFGLTDLDASYGSTNAV